ncbi:MAG TPA: bifunctional diaminohydroxyphosphoribosylaminopyrimidine deaminase/5-amino-6-(5-phosphoribosylamino)uracil reductase RibD [bacterium]|nr:bifunctional diaminohydroxyphosphoribosylaminopyrimidine deaminase/5-amino-6-(5-phosphoribosylamino)uracil reductase RibD [bacterium]HPR88163.1 bifunctional diaminohydroxyphosphoribosylaminopyrimidine deaminase/5-amino-6-(5-phosphoribosylamino)uracil reductase RibD [bacterium]
MLQNGSSAIDQHYMARALELAEKGRGMVSPNPMVGALLVKEGRIIAEGWHQRLGGAHAEINVIDLAGEAAEEATLYVTLEPCCHQGRTGPCVERIFSAGIVRVVAAMQDPNPLVNGKGFAWLRTRGIELTTGVMEAEAATLNAGYCTWITLDRPLVTLKVAQSLDGRIATSTGHSKWISSKESRIEAHRLRSRHDALLIGINTVLADDPQLTVRLVEAVSPHRLVLDSHLRVPLDARIIADSMPHRTTIVTTPVASKEKISRIQEKGASVLVLPEDERGWVDQQALWRKLAETGCTSVLIEGGSVVATACLKTHAVDRIALFIAPKIIGSGIDAIGDLGIRALPTAIQIEEMKVDILPVDILVQGQVRYLD